MKKYSIFALIVSCVFLTSASVSAHDAFKEPLEKHYGLKSVSCKACHPNNKDRSIHNKFGMYFVAELKGTDITKKFNAAAEKGKEAQETYEKEMAVIFEKALKAVEKKSITFEDLIKAGLLNGTRMDSKKMAANKGSGATEKPADEAGGK